MAEATEFEPGVSSGAAALLSTAVSDDDAFAQAVDHLMDVTDSSELLV